MAQPVECPPRPTRSGGATRVDHERPDPLKWRARIKSTPTGHYWFRVVVAIVGFGLIIAALLTGWLPGPGGVPLFLSGLAVLSSEFFWAKSLNRWLMRYVRVYLCWSSKQKRLFWAGFFATVGVIWWIVLVVTGIPSWMPAKMASLLAHLPGVD